MTTVAMRRLLKFVVMSQVTEIRTADEPRFLWVAFQGNELCVWAEATVGDEVATRLAAFMTGDPVPDDAEWIGSAQTVTPAGPFVAHVYRAVR